MNLFKQIINKINLYLRKSINQKNRAKLINNEITLIASNCIGGFILHDLNLQFNSPFVNLYLAPKDFIRYLQRIEFYQNQPLHFIQTDKNYPVGKLSDLEIHFMHYKNEQEAKQKWEQRTQRMQLDQLFIIMTDRDGCSYQELIEFEQLPYQNKVVFTHKPYPEFNSAVHISGFENDTMVGHLFEYSGLNGQRYYDQFNYIDWFNQANR